MGKYWDKTPIAYYGGKINLVDDILPLLDFSKKEFVSLFTGGAAVEFAKKKHEVEVWNDIDVRVINFWEVLQNEELFEELSILIKGTLHCEYYHKLAAIILKDQKNYTKPERAWAFWVQTNMSFGHTIFGGFAFAHDNSRNGATMVKRETWDDKFYKRVKHVQIFQRDALNLLKVKDSRDTFFFIDPPYVSSDMGHYGGIFVNDDFKKLLDGLAEIEGTFLMTSYPESILMEYREKHGWESQDKQCVLAVDGRRAERKYKIECITYNYKIQQSLDLKF